ncbi:hypothetical protein [Pseudorhodoferax sp.]|uniref:hypothetical protein n=1 Tax=Pseudorhodoferax sp. TaxID=1993553 RepID=UPI002DD65F43|nr:hypothetical protein [Pseudorhodoferax sp.]
MPSASDTAERPLNDTAEGGLRMLRAVVDSGLLRCGLPTALGGLGGTLAELADAAVQWAAHSRAAGWTLWAQRMAIEAIACSPNVGLREHLLPDLLSGERAASVPLPLAAAPLSGRDTGRGWLLDGALPCVPNWQWMGCSIVAPVRLGAEHGWVVLRSEEDGLHIGAPQGGVAPPALSRSVSLRCAGVFFREDEWLGGSDLAGRLALLDRLLAPLRQSG